MSFPQRPVVWDCKYTSISEIRKTFSCFFVLFFSILFILSSVDGVFSVADTFNISAILLLLQLRI